MAAAAPSASEARQPETEGHTVRVALLVTPVMAERIHQVALVRRNSRDVDAIRWMLDCMLDTWDALPEDKKRLV